MRRVNFEPGPDRDEVQTTQERNIRLVLTEIAKKPGGTAADASRVCNLSAATVSRLCEILLERGLIYEGERIHGKRGQPGISLHLNRSGAYSIGCQIGHGKCNILIRSIGSEVICEGEFEIDNCDTLHVAQKCFEAYSALLTSLDDEIESRIIGFGVAVPTDFEYLCDQGQDRQKPRDAWDRNHFEDKLQGLSGFPVQCFTKGAAGAWAELAAIRPPRPADFIYFYLDGSIQTGLLLNGELWCGPTMSTGNIGRLVANEHGEQEYIYDLFNSYYKVANDQRAQSNNTVAIDGWIDKATFSIARAALGVTEVLEVPLIIIEADKNFHHLEQFMGQMSDYLRQFAWRSPPQLKSGLAGHMAPMNGVALRLIYDRFFA